MNLFYVFLLIIFPVLSSANDLRLAVPDFPGAKVELDAALVKINELMLKEHKTRIEFVYLPTKRTLVALKNGQVEGVVRDSKADITPIVPGVLMIEAPLFRYSLSEFYLERTQTEPVSPFVAIRRGSADAAGLCKQSDCIYAASEQQLLELLYAGRVGKFYSPTFLIDATDARYIKQKVLHRVVSYGTAHIFLDAKYQKYVSTLEKYTLE